MVRIARESTGMILYGCLMAVLLTGCGRPEDSGSADGSDAPRDGSAVLPNDPHFMMVVREVDDVDTWTEAYDSRLPARQEEGLSEVLLAEDLDRPETVVSIHQALDIERATKYVRAGDDPSGATEPADAIMLRMVELGPQPERPVALVMIRHRVRDYPAWRAAFDTRAGARSAAGLHLAGIGLGLHDDRSVQVTLFATDLEAARKWAEEIAGLSSVISADSAVEGPAIRFLDPIRAEPATASD